MASFLLRKSSLTEAQLDTILAAKTNGNLSEKVLLRENGRVSKGAFVASLRQAEKNIEESMYTLFLLSYLNLTPIEFGGQLTRTVSMLTRLKGVEAEKDTLLELIRAMEELVERISGKRKLIS